MNAKYNFPNLAKRKLAVGGSIPDIQTLAMQIARDRGIGYKEALPFAQQELDSIIGNAPPSTINPNINPQPVTPVGIQNPLPTSNMVSGLLPNTTNNTTTNGNGGLSFLKPLAQTAGSLLGIKPTNITNATTPTQNPSSGGLDLGKYLSFNAQNQQAKGIKRENLFNSALALKNAVDANSNFKKLSQLQRPSFEANRIVNPITGIDPALMNNQISNINNQANSARSSVARNSGDINTLIAANQGIQSNTNEALTNLSLQDANAIKQDTARFTGEQNALNQQNFDLNRQFKESEFADKANFLTNAMQDSNRSFQANLQNVKLGNRNLEDLNFSRQNELQKLSLSAMQNEQQFLNNAMVSDKSYYENEDGTPTTPQQKQEKVAQYKQQWQQGQGARYQELLNKMNSFDNPYENNFLGMFKKGGKISREERRLVNSLLPSPSNQDEEITKRLMLRLLADASRNNINFFRNNINKYKKK